MSEPRQPAPLPSPQELADRVRLLEERIAQLKRANDELARVDKLRSDLVSEVSHELRTPLATVKEFASILADGLAGATTPDQQEYLKIVHANVDRMARLIEDLLDSAKIESGQVALVKTFIEARPLLDQVLRSMQPLLDTKQLQLDLRLPDGVVGVFVDVDKVTQVLTNLVSNAVAFTPDRGRLTITVEEQANEVAFHVTDTGIGIDADDVPKLFEKFPRLRRPPAVHGTKGTGLGLAICKRLVELHGGRIWAKSQVGSGSTFSFTIPKYHMEEVFKEYIKSGIAQAAKRQGQFSVVMLTIAEFAQLKTRHGAESMTQLLRGLEQVVRETTRRGSGDVIVRWQYGEMVVILAEVDRAGSLAIADRLKRVVEGRTFTAHDTELRLNVVTHSATYPDDAVTAEDFLKVVEGRFLVSRSRPRILVVDDEAKIRTFLKEALELRDFQVLTAASGPDALEQLQAQAVELILLDVMMPVMDGYEVYHLLRENPKTRDIPVIIITAKGERVDRALGMESATYNYLMKPFQLDELLAKVQELLQRPQTTGSAS